MNNYSAKFYYTRKSHDMLAPVESYPNNIFPPSPHHTPRLNSHDILVTIAINNDFSVQASTKHYLLQMSSIEVKEEDTESVTTLLQHEEPHLGDVLVVGGCGFLGHHVVKFLLAEPTCTSIAVMSRSPFSNRLKGVTYHIGDITIPEHVKHVVNQVKPRVIINTASPHAYIDHEHAIENFRVNVDGNQTLLDEAANFGTVKAFVYTSSGPIIAGKGGAYDHADETFPTLAGNRTGDPYHIAKAIGDKQTLDANGKNGKILHLHTSLGIF
jgi:3-beta hydroxysteroid dehydrogenase/isomerase family